MSSTSKLLMKLSLTADETPDLFHALASVKDAKRRTGRLKDLAAKGLLLERSSGAVAGLVPPAMSTVPAGDAEQGDALRRHLPPGVTGSGLVSAWDEPGGDGDARQA